MSPLRSESDRLPPVRCVSAQILPLWEHFSDTDLETNVPLAPLPFENFPHAWPGCTVTAHDSSLCLISKARDSDCHQ